MKKTNNTSTSYSVLSDIPTLGENNSVEETVLKSSRRGFIITSTAALAGVIASTSEADAGLFGYSSRPVNGIPESWVRLKGKDVYRYANFIKGLGLKNITPRMVLAPHFKKRGYVTNSIPPKSKWKKMAATLKVVDRMSSEMGRPVSSILSAYRSPRYNYAVGGKSRSLHMQNQAIDVTFRGASPYYVASVAKHLRSKRKFSGGVGTYRSFVHIDTRGYNASW